MAEIAKNTGKMSKYKTKSNGWLKLCPASATPSGSSMNAIWTTVVYENKYPLLHNNSVKYHPI